MSLSRRLHARVGRRDLDTVVRVYNAYKDHLMTIATCLLGDVGAAEDVVHDVFVRFVATDGHVSNLRAYLVACVANRARDQLRRANRVAVSLEKANEPASECGNPAAQAIDDECAARVVASLGVLPQEQREVIVLHLQGQMTFKDIARNLGISINTVQSRYRYGVGKLKVLLNVESDHEATE